LVEFCAERRDGSNLYGARPDSSAACAIRQGTPAARSARRIAIASAAVVASGFDQERLPRRRHRLGDSAVQRRRYDHDDGVDGRIGDEVAPVGVEARSELRGLRRAADGVAAAKGSQRETGDVARHVSRVALSVLARADEADADRGRHETLGR
jgi:hypothetical protein